MRDGTSYFSNCSECKAEQQTDDWVVKTGIRVRVSAFLNRDKMTPLPSMVLNSKLLARIAASTTFRVI